MVHVTIAAVQRVRLCKRDVVADGVSIKKGSDATEACDECAFASDRAAENRVLNRSLVGEITVKHHHPNAVIVLKKEVLDLVFGEIRRYFGGGV